jgi:hypothetical protein
VSETARPPEIVIDLIETFVWEEAGGLVKYTHQVEPRERILYMASKRSNGSEPVVSAGAASAPGKSKVTRKRKSAVAAETHEDFMPVSRATEPPAAFPTDSTVATPTFEEIAQLAYSYWEARGYQGGSPQDDWLRAESELRSPRTVSTARA